MGAQFTYCEDLGSEVEVPTKGIISRTVFQDYYTKVVLFGFDTGQELSEHTASMPATIQIISGEGKLVLGGEEKSAKPGTFVYMEAHLAHSIVASSPLVMLLTMLKSAKE